MARVRNFIQRTKNANYTLKGSGLLHIDIYNQGTKSILVGGREVQPGKRFSIPSDGIPLSKGFELDIIVTGADASENIVQISTTTLGEDHC